MDGMIWIWKGQATTTEAEYPGLSLFLDPNNAESRALSISWIITAPGWYRFDIINRIGDPRRFSTSLPFAVVDELRVMAERRYRRTSGMSVRSAGTGKSHLALGLGLAACQRGYAVLWTTAAALVNTLIEARDEKRLMRYQKTLAKVQLLIVDELGFVPLSKTGAELLFEVFSQRHERGSTLVTSNLPFDKWTEVFGSQRLTGALLDRLTHHVHVLTCNGDSYRLADAKRHRAKAATKKTDRD